SGPTTISAGVLQIGAGGSTGTLGTGAIVDNATLAFDRSGTLLVPGAIGGTGSVQQLGAGTTVLTGANTYSGATSIAAGALQIGNGGTTGTLGVGPVSNAGSLVFDRSDAINVANAIGGTGTIVHAGTGSTTLLGVVSASATNVNAGTQLVAG